MRQRSFGTLCLGAAMVALLFTLVACGASSGGGGGGSSTETPAPSTASKWGSLIWGQAKWGSNP